MQAASAFCILPSEFASYCSGIDLVGCFTGNGGAVWHGVGLNPESFASSRKFVLV